MTDLEALKAMLRRCRIHFEESTSNGCVTEIEISPDDERWGEMTDDEKSPNLTGVPWATTDFNFDTDGQLIGIHMEGD
ncbi:MAG TPA: hypothetical protein VIV60_27195 [Polyangiaceae bacterium]